MIILDGYTVRKCVQETPRAHIYSALRERDASIVLLKCYQADRARDPRVRARREYDALRKVAGPNVVRALDLHLSGERPVLVLDWVPGIDLKTLLESRSLEPAEFLEIAVSLAEALARIHDERLIHRDIKPANVMVDPRTLDTTIVDFGLALSYGSRGSSSDVSLASDGFAGTLLYVAPEQTGRMDRGVDFRSDLYSLGATFYHALTGHPPFESSDALNLIHAHVARVPRSPLERRPGLPATLSRIVVKLLQKEPEDRYQTAHALHRDLLESRDQLRRTGHIDDDFPLGTADAPFRPLFAKRLYGREPEIAALHSAYGRSAAGAAELVLLRGAPGIGKSALVHELRRMLANTGGYLASGKFDLYRRGLPYAGFIATFESLIQQMLTESEERLVRWREKLRESLGGLAAVIVDLVPDFGIIVGDVPAAPPLGPSETQARLALAVDRFVRSCATRDHPLVLFLDDLQWADAGSRYLLEDLLIQGEATALLVIAAYRDSEVDTSHPFAELLQRLEQRKVHSISIAVAPLSIPAAAQMLADALARPVAATHSLAECAALKTGSTPLLIQQFIHHLHGLGLIRFVHGTGWTWEDAEVAAADIPEDAVSLMMAKLQRLEPKALELIRFASCVGDQFDSKLLAELTGEGIELLEPPLFVLAEEGLLAPSASGFRFVHDRIREAAQELLGTEQRSVLHHRAGMLLLGRTAPELLAERCFEIADHLNRGLDQLSEAERLKAFDINLTAGQRALSAGAAATANTYFGFARGLFRDSDWSDAKLAFALFWNAAESALQTKSFELALNLLDTLEAQSLSVLQQGQVVGKRLAILTFMREPDVIEIMLDALRRFGVRWPRTPSKLRVRLDVLRTDWALRGPLDERLFPTDTSDRAWLAPMLVNAGGGGALVRSSTAFGCMMSGYSLRAQRRHGLARGPSFTIACYGAFRICVLDHPRGAARYARAALEWAERMPNPALEVRCEFELHALLYPWIKARRKMLDVLLRTSEKAREVGDNEYSIYSLRQRATYAALCGEPLADVVRGFAVLQQRDPAQGEAYYEGYIQSYQLLVKAQPGEWRKALAVTEERLAGLIDAGSVWLHWIICLCFLGQYEAACARAEDVHDLVSSTGAAGSSVLDFCLFRGLAAAVAAQSPSQSRWARTRLLRVTRSCARRLARWSHHGPDFAHMARFLEAESARARGDVAKALGLYGQSIRRAREQGYRHHAALAHERRADLLAAERRHSEALLGYRDARALYEEWGAKGKVREIDECADLRTATT